jgi:hypothetical protein
MEQQEAPVHFIATRRAAIIAVSLTAWVTAMTFRAVFVPPQSQSSWMIQPAFGSPSWAVIANAGLYIFFCWLGITMFKTTRGNEQLLVGVGLLVYSSNQFNISLRLSPYRFSA